MPIHTGDLKIKHFHHHHLHQNPTSASSNVESERYSNAQYGGEDNEGHASSRMRKLLTHVQSSILHRKINFHKATTPDEPSDEVSKYIPLNGEKVQVQSSSTNANGSTSDRPNTTRSNSTEKKRDQANEDGFQEPKKILFPKARINGITLNVTS